MTLTLRIWSFVTRLFRVSKARSTAATFSSILADLERESQQFIILTLERHANRE
jgi:hypothetical protein